MRPLIGLTTYREQARWGVWDTTADLLPTVYARSVEAVGGLPVLLPPTTPYTEAADAVLARLDGLIVTGGADVVPGRYGAQPHPSVRETREDRDAWETALLERAAERGTPTLGICRGMQVLAVQAGGSLAQHLPDVIGHAAHNPAPGTFGEVEVDVLPGSLLHSLVGDRLDVHCHHHQGVLDHPGLEAVAWAPDGTVEAVEARGDRFCVGVQWHPEMAVDAGIFAALVRAAAAAG